MPNSAGPAEPFRQTLINTERNINASAEITGRSVTLDCPTDWSVRTIALRGGKQEGVDLVVIDNGRLRISLIPTRGMGIFEVVMGDVRLGWDSPVREIVHPSFVTLQSRGGLGWLEGFNEFIVRCGMESCGAPGVDTFINNNGDEATMELTLHGKVANLPAQELEVIVERQPPHRIRVRGRVDERTMFGPKLELWTELSTEIGSNAFRICDVITNRGAGEQEFQMLYHCNVGRPLLQAGSTFLAPVERVTPINETAAKSVGRYAQFSGPQAGFVEQVYCMRPLAGEDGRTLTMLCNAHRDRGMSLSFRPSELPYLTLWKNTAAEADGYVTGIEPATGFPQNRALERKAGRVPRLAAGASRSMALDFAVLASADEVRRCADAIARVQSQRAPVVDEKPAKPL